MIHVLYCYKWLEWNVCMRARCVCDDCEWKLMSWMSETTHIYLCKIENLEKLTNRGNFATFFFLKKINKLINLNGKSFAC